jgi:hypothetical protein
MDMDYQDPYKKSEKDMELINAMLGEIALLPDLSERYYDKAIDLRMSSQSKLAECNTPMTETEIISTFCTWYGSAYLLQMLGEYGICRHELKRFDCGICSRDILIKREED